MSNDWTLESVEVSGLHLLGNHGGEAVQVSYRSNKLDSRVYGLSIHGDFLHLKPSSCAPVTGLSPAAIAADIAYNLGQPHLCHVDMKGVRPEQAAAFAATAASLAERLQTNFGVDRIEPRVPEKI